jgi:hypothetical protein
LAVVFLVVLFFVVVLFFAPPDFEAAFAMALSF